MAKAYRDEKDQVLGYVLVEIPRSTIDVIVNEYAEQYKTMFMILNHSGAIIYHTSGLEYEGLGKTEEYGFNNFNNNWKDKTTGIIGDTFAYSRSDAYGLLYIKEMPSDVMNKIMSAILKAMIPGLMIIAVLGLEMCIRDRSYFLPGGLEAGRRTLSGIPHLSASAERDHF